MERGLKGGRWPLIIIRGGGDLGSGCAARLFRAGFPVLICELERPRMVRRSVCFGEAVWEGKVSIEGIEGRLVDFPTTPNPQWLAQVQAKRYIGVVVDASGESLERLTPAVVVDARMLKGGYGEGRSPRWGSIGLGPGFEAGANIDLIVETMRGHSLGRVIREGSALPNTGVPGIVGGEGARRLIRAPRAGVFRGEVELGALVEAGQRVGWVEDRPVLVSLSGLLRGLMRSGTEVREGEKLGDCDPRGAEIDLYAISDKARAVAGGVLEGVLTILGERGWGWMAPK